MGRQELYEELPFLAVPGLQKKEHSLSVAFSSYAAALDTLEADEYLAFTTGKGLNPEEKEQRLSHVSLLLLDELEVDAITVTTPLIFAVLIASLLMFNAGYNISVMNAPGPFVFAGHSTGAWSVAVSAFCVGGPAGSVLAGKWADERGRRAALVTTTWLFIVGGLIQSMAPSLIVVTIARVVIGVASGASTVLVPIYLGELGEKSSECVYERTIDFSSSPTPTTSPTQSARSDWHNDAIRVGRWHPVRRPRWILTGERNGLAMDVLHDFRDCNLSVAVDAIPVGES